MRDAVAGDQVIRTLGFYRELVESTSVALLVVGSNAVVLHHTAAAAEMLTGRRTSVAGELFPSLFAPDFQDEVDSFLRRASVEDANVGIRVQAGCRLVDGRERTIAMTATNLTGSPDVAGIVLTLVDRSEMQRAVSLAEQVARRDQLTGLLTRNALEQHGQTLFTDDAAGAAMLALLDVDDMKVINDLHGFMAGDRVLRAVADRLSTSAGDSAMVARFGGERFAVLFPHCGATTARRRLDAACRSIRTPLPGLDLQVTVTCGGASTRMARHWPGVVSRAEAALLEAKMSKPGGVFFYRRDTPGWDERRRHEREELQTAGRMVVALTSDVVRLEHETRYDQRTGLLNAQAFEADLEMMHADATAQASTYSLVLCDIDYFHNYNERYLYQPANITLRRVADGLKGACRPGDVVYRYGGEEMTVLLPRTSVPDATSLAERLRSAVADLQIPHEHRPEPHIVTVSIGVAECAPRPGQSSAGVVDAANRALLVAKQSGRNRVEACHQGES
jgi:diguanylate cyclase (GGDEF)-like protein/PAS domain S-box-containing protein